MLSVSKPRPSLVELKKQQWAREREEMSQLYLPWGSGERYNRLQIRNQFASTLELHKQSSYEYQEPIQRQRSPSLPPIHHIDSKEDNRRNKEVLNRNIPSAKRFAFYDEDGEGDTSGYGSETLNHMNIRAPGGALHDVAANRNPVLAWHHDDPHHDHRDGPPSGGRSGATDIPWSARSSGEEGRPRWGDRGVATGRLWEPTAPNERLPQMQNQKKGTPSWVERGLNMIDNTAEVLVIDQRSSTNNSGLDCDRSSSNGSDEGRTFLRGQNVPLEPEIKAQRENKRIKALELQSAILNQLEEQEKRRMEEKERKLREERLEELRIQRQQEEDRLKLDDERRKNDEKRMKEQRKLETLKRALEEAELKARQEKEKRYSSLKQITQPNSYIEIKKEVENIKDTVNNNRCDTVSPTKSNRTYEVNSAKSQKKEYASHQTTGFSSPGSAGTGHVNLYVHSVPPIALADNQFNIVPIGINSNGELVNGQTSGIQLAVLVPQSLNNNLYNVSLNSLNNISEISETGRLLTPRKYRSLIKTKDVWTQTDDIDINSKTNARKTEMDEERNNDKYYSNIDENAPHESHSSTLKKDRRFRSEERYKKDLETRPKWGVNRPAAQYKKQSEKDPFYSQKRKMRQKYRSQARQYISQSSDDSRSPSPPARSEKNNDNSTKQRNSLSQSYWRRKRSIQDYRNNFVSEVSNTSDYNMGQQTESDVTEIKKSPVLSTTKRITLSQKFINDKYGNRRLWVEDFNDRNPKNNTIDTENRKKTNDHINSDKIDYLDKNDDGQLLDLHTKL